MRVAVGMMPAGEMARAAETAHAGDNKRDAETARDKTNNKPNAPEKSAALPTRKRTVSASTNAPVKAADANAAARPAFAKGRGSLKPSHGIPTAPVRHGTQAPANNA